MGKFLLFASFCRRGVMKDLYGTDEVFGKRLRDLREDCDMTRADLAKKLNLTAHTIESYERGKSHPSDVTKVKVAKLFDVSLDFLLGLVDSKCSYADKHNIAMPKSLTEANERMIFEYIEMIKLKQKTEDEEKGKEKLPV
jgi:transcriptional regulator with XRE-family HTH domain